METDTSFLENHQSKCRCCFKTFGKREKSIKITKAIEVQFFDLTQLKLKSSTAKYSQKICSGCCNELNSCTKFRDSLLWKQKELYKLVDKKHNSKHKRSQEPEDVPSKFEIKQEIEKFPTENCIVIEPIIKTEKFEEESNEHDLGPLEHLYESDEHIKLEKSESESSAGPFDDFFRSEIVPRKKRKKAKSNITERKSAVWHYCPHCDKKFYTLETLQVHIDSYHFKYKNFQCQLCDFKTTKPCLLKGHIARVHDRTQPIPSDKGMPKTPCPICGLLVQKASSHIRNVHVRPKNVFCDICGFGIFNLNRLRRHMFKHLSKETKRELVSYQCDLCGAQLHSKNSVKAHINNLHMRTGEKDFKCFCGKSYKAESYLKIHQKTHERTAKHPCLICDKKFMNPSQLKIHMEIHERKGKKEYSCEICGGMYASVILLERHKIFHTDPKHACQYCGKKYHRPCLVERHVKRQHEIEEIPCQFCGKMLNILSMTRHVKEFHSGLPRLNCPVPGCNGTYLRRFHLKDHIQRSHKNYLDLLTQDEKNTLDQQINDMNLI